MRLLPLLLISLAALPAAAADLFTPRVFDIVPPEGREVQRVDGFTVLRQPGTTFGAVLTFSPESGVGAWVPVAVLNSSPAALEVGTHGVSARYGDTALKVWPTSALVRDAKKRRDDPYDAGSDEYEARNLADAQFEALKARLFQDETIAPRAVARGDVRIDLPPRREGGEPTEFVLTLAFGGQTMDVLYRERTSTVDVGEVVPGQ